MHNRGAIDNRSNHNRSTTGLHWHSQESDYGRMTYNMLNEYMYMYTWQIISN